MKDSIYAQIRENEKSMRVKVMIPHDEEARIVVSALIRTRNAYVNRNEDMAHFDKVIRHYIDEDEFEKYVINKEEIE